MENNSKTKPMNRFTSILIGNVELPKGFYLPTGADKTVTKNRIKKDGYAYFDGETLTLWAM